MNKILEEYILKNTREKFEETPFGQIVADEVNYVINNMPEIKLARDVLEEEAFGELAGQAAQQVLKLVAAELKKAVPNLVSQMAEKIKDDARKEIEDATANVQQSTQDTGEITQDFSS